MTDLRKIINSFLKTIHPRIYFQVAPNQAVFPYIVYDFPSYSDEGELQELIVIDIDGWDRPANGDTSELENLMERINSLNKKNIVTDHLVVSFYLDRKIPLTDSDLSIKRRKYVYQARLFKEE